MDVSFIVVLWIIISIAQAINDRKKAPPPPQVPPQDLDFEIPPLANDPNKPAEVEEFEVLNLEEINARRKQLEERISAGKVKTESESEIVEEKNNADLDLTPAAVMNSIIMNEILDKPKALRRKKF